MSDSSDLVSVQLDVLEMEEWGKARPVTALHTSSTTLMTAGVKNVDSSSPMRSFVDCHSLDKH